MITCRRLFRSSGTAAASAGMGAANETVLGGTEQAAASGTEA